VNTRYGNPEFESECRRGTDLERYLIDPATFPQLRCLDEERRLDLTGGFDHIMPRIGESASDLALAVMVRVLYRIRLLRAFYASYRRYAASVLRLFNILSETMRSSRQYRIAVR
jgi:hypothetical protein